VVIELFYIVSKNEGRKGQNHLLCWLKGSKKVLSVDIELFYIVSKNKGKMGQTIYCAGALLATISY
jgi:hypothetical protein